MLYNMKKLVSFLAIVSAVSAQRGVSKSSPSVPPLILKQTSEVNPDGTYQYSYETENGIRAAESSYLNSRGSPFGAQTVQGSYSYTAPDGTPITVTYTADENGFQAQGAHLPVAPEIPALIAKALAYIAANAEVEGGDQHQQRPPSYQYPIYTTTPPHSSGFASGTEL